MKRATFVTLSLLMVMAGLVAVAGAAWAIWVIADGDTWILELMFQRVSAETSCAIICVISGIIASASFWGARRVFPRRIT
jgi:hypothetical protein